MEIDSDRITVTLAPSRQRYWYYHQQTRLATAARTSKNWLTKFQVKLEIAGKQSANDRNELWSVMRAYESSTEWISKNSRGSIETHNYRA